MKGIDHWELYSLYIHPDDIRAERDIEELKREVFRQRVFIEQQDAKIHKLEAELVFLRGFRNMRRNFSNG